MALKIYVNHPTSDEYALACGKFLINFGVVEFQSRIWLQALGVGRDKQFDSSFPKQLEKRIERVVALIDKSDLFVQSDKALAISNWRKLNDEGRPLRNSIFHSPFVMGLSDDNLQGAPKVCGFLNQKRDGSEELISIEEINGGTDATKKLIEALAGILAKTQSTAS